MSNRFVPLTPRIGARVAMGKQEVLDPANADEAFRQLLHLSQWTETHWQDLTGSNPLRLE